MNWVAVGAVADAVAAFGVIASLIYLGLQIREQTKQSRLSATREMVRDYGTTLLAIMSDEKTWDAFLRATSDYESLAGGDQIKADWIFSSAMRALELLYFHMAQRHFDPIAFASLEYRVKRAGQLPGFRCWWTNNKEQFSPEFVTYVEQLWAINRGEISSDQVPTP